MEPVVEAGAGHDVPAEVTSMHRAHSEQMLEIVKGAQVAESKRQKRLGSVKTSGEKEKLEKRFTRERRAEETRIKQVHDEHRHLMKVSHSRTRASAGAACPTPLPERSPGRHARARRTRPGRGI